MKLKNVLIVVSDIRKSVEFYHDLFGLNVVLDNDGNVIMTDGLVLQDRSIWEKFLNRETMIDSNQSELYFEDDDVEGFVEKLKAYKEPVTFVNELMIHEWGQTVTRFYDPDGNLIEVGTPMGFADQYIADQNDERIR